ncbi:hypothetical protein Mpal_0714 [Methanosphaerula palustris E1-9c]|uniref:Uncharacterized protein n=1 Tax=Methanosphaerula palustris (strain ATCC BAA-1556 / DSM 19958 / E1-9c) TaxID=521011 RepID=B8GG06_METPE|nr:hypothetical protein Mpal_0714 [Methanosphaerula palustris E1-9c]
MTAVAVGPAAGCRSEDEIVKRISLSCEIIRQIISGYKI